MYYSYVKTEEGEECYNIHSNSQLTVDNLKSIRNIMIYALDLDKENKEHLITNTSQVNRQDTIQFGYKLQFESPWSTHMKNIIIQSDNKLSNIVRVEKTLRIDKKYWKTYEETGSFDKILHQTYDEPIKTFTQNYINPELKTKHISVKSIPDVNKSMGLSMDDDDIKYYKNLFENTYKRNPTNIELFDLAQSNSEHSRHWFFNGKLSLNKKLLPLSLFKMIKLTLPEKTNSVLAFCDNSSSIKGPNIEVLSSQYNAIYNRHNYEKVNSKYNIVFTAETHNFPTGIAPFAGAATGTGGRIRDNQAIGRGGLLIAGTAGYCVGNLFIDGYELPWEQYEQQQYDKTNSIYSELPATPLKIAIEASNGASDYGNKIGEPIINGFARSFGMTLKKHGMFSSPRRHGERIEWLKPIMFTGGIGQMDAEHTKKTTVKSGMLICRLGGPAYRIGFGGGAASSRNQDNKNSKFDMCAVQRGDPEMENKLNKVIRTCIELGTKNPIQSIHDQGAGGLGNVCKEIIYPCGGNIYLKNVSLGDQTLTDIEIWTCEYQEVNVCLIYKRDEELLKDICKREKLCLDIIGETEKSESIIVYGKNGDKIVDLELDNILGKIPQKKYVLTKRDINLPEINYSRQLKVNEIADRVLRLLSVGSKRFLTNKVDRSVTGLIAQQQCVGPLHTPISNYGLVAQTYYSLKGAVTAIGEQPLKGVCCPEAMAEMTVGEMITNIMWVVIDKIEDIKCSGNWMWDLKKDGEKYALYKACETMCEIVKKIGISLDGGKDSLSMSTTVKKQQISSPRQLVLSGYAACDDITKKITPDFKCSGSSLLLITFSETFKTRMGGTAFAQVYNQIGNEKDMPRMDNPEIVKKVFSCIQDFIKRGLILSGHDRSDGGLFTAIIESAISGNRGCVISISEKYDLIPFLWNEELGIIVEVSSRYVKPVLHTLYAQQIPVLHIGQVNNSKQVKIIHGIKEAYSEKLSDIRKKWETTSFELEKLQCDKTCVEREMRTFESYDYYDEDNVSKTYYRCAINPEVIQYLQNPISRLLGPMKKHDKFKVAIVREEGSNGEREMASAFYYAGFHPVDVTMTDLMDKKFSLQKFRGIVFVGGFSYADTMGAASGWATVITKNTILFEKIKNFVNRKDTFSLGVCNGCQLMVKLGLLSHNLIMRQNVSKRFESRFSYVEIQTEQNTNSVFFDGLNKTRMGVWVAHGEGRFDYINNDSVEGPPNSNVTEIKNIAGCNIPMKYIDMSGKQTMEYPYNPNGSFAAAAAVSSIDGRHLAMMPHPERSIMSWQVPWMPSSWKYYPFYPWLYMFHSVHKWCVRTNNF